MSSAYSISREHHDRLTKVMEFVAVPTDRYLERFSLQI